MWGIYFLAGLALTVLWMDVEHQRMEVLQWLSTVTYLDLYNSGCQRRAANTCEWLLEREEFLSWKTSQMSSILWVHGKGMHLLPPRSCKTSPGTN